MTPATEQIALTGGPLVSLAAVQVLLSLEARGFQIRSGADGAILISPRASLTAADDAAIRAVRLDLGALVRYCETLARVIWVGPAAAAGRGARRGEEAHR